MKLTLVVACALIDADNRVLIAQRAEGKQLAGLWEFPGGKLEPDERPEPALIRELAEELGITSKNIDEAMKSTKPEVMRFVGNEGTYGEDMRLTKDWAARIIRHVGNYGEVFERNLGNDSPLGIPRGLNQLWNAGGIQYAPPIL